MNTTDLYFSDAYLKHQVHLLRFTSSEQAKVDALFRAMVPELKNKLNNGLTDFSKRRVNAVLKQTEEVIDRYYGMMGTGKAIDPEVWKMTLDEFKAAKVNGYRLKKLYAEDIAVAEGDGIISLDPKKFFEQGEWARKQVIFHEKAHFLEETISPDYKASLFDDQTVMGYRGRNINEKLANMIQDGKVPAKILKDYPALAAKGVQTTPQAIGYAGLAKTEADFTAKTFTSIGLDASLPSEATLKALVNGSLIEGAPSAKWWAKQSDDLAFKFSNQVRQGVAQNETVQQIVRRIAGSKKLGIPGIMDVSRRNASALVHTSIQQVSNDARMATFKENSDVVKGMRQLSTFDSKTSEICMSYSGAEWDLDGVPINGNTLPYGGGCPRHFNCRSLTVPITLTFKELGLDVPEVKGTRASDLGQIKSDTTFDEFLKRHDAAYQDDLLGPGRAKLFRDGKLTMSDLMGQHDRPLSLKQLGGA